MGVEVNEICFQIFNQIFINLYFEGFCSKIFFETIFVFLILKSSEGAKG